MWRAGEVREGRNRRAELGWEGYGDPGCSVVSLSNPSLETLRQTRIREKTETNSVKQGWQRGKGLISFQIPRATTDFTSWNQSGPIGTLETNRSVSKRNSVLRWDTTFQAAHITFFFFFGNFGVYLRNYLQNTESQDRKGQNIKRYPSREERPQTKLQRH